MAQETVKEEAVVAKTKSGIEIKYHEKPRRFYEIRQGKDGEWRECDISVSGVTDVLNKAGLPWWGMTIGIQSLIDVWNIGEIRPAQDGKLAVWTGAQYEYATVANIVEQFKRKKLTVNDVRDQAGDRGNSVHKALEVYVETGAMPVPEFYPEMDEQGAPVRAYVEGLVKFLGDLGPLKSKPQAEIMVGSVEHRFAGRYDMEVVLQEANLVTHLPTPAWPKPGSKPEERRVFKGRTLFDLKTPKGIYASHHLQLSGYEGARIECGMPKTEQQIIVRVGADGNYQVAKNDSTYEEFLLALNLARAVERIEKSGKRGSA